MELETASLAVNGMIASSAYKVLGRKELRTCCRETIATHAANNALMVCGDCRQIIKCFSDEKSFRNYRAFCESRSREIFTTKYENFNIIAFQSYDLYGK